MRLHRRMRLLPGRLAALVVLGFVVGAAACVIETEPPPRKPLLRDVLRARGGPAPSASSSPGAPDPMPVPPPAPDAFRACSADADCVAVLPNGCCHDGRNIALNKTLVEAYKSTFTCPTSRPMCPMHLVLDRRVPVCDATAHLCTLVSPTGDASPPSQP